MNLHEIINKILGIKYCNRCEIKLDEDTGMKEFRNGCFCSKCADKERKERM